MKVNKKKVLKTVKRGLKQMGKDFGRSPLARAAKGKRTRGFTR